MTSTAGENIQVWRYMSFARFVWLLQKKKLWLSRADLLGDPWEISLSGNQLDHVISRHPITPIGSPRTEGAMERSERIIRLWRRRTFVSCWSAAKHESHALWRIYCRSVEGVAVQTTLARLQASVGALPVYQVTYEMPGSSRQTPTLDDLVTKKRPMFAYEHEVRVVYVSEDEAEQNSPGYVVDWNPEKHLESVRVHPEADHSFMETAVATVEQYAPALKERVSWSDMNARPPF